MKKIEDARISSDYLDDNSVLYRFFRDFIVQNYDGIKECIQICTDFKKKEMHECDSFEIKIIGEELLYSIRRFFDSEVEQKNDVKMEV